MPNQHTEPDLTPEQRADRRRELNRQAQRRRRERLAKARPPKPPPPHGTRRRYRQGCDCQACRDANTAATTASRKRKAADR